MLPTTELSFQLRFLPDPDVLTRSLPRCVCPFTFVNRPPITALLPDPETTTACTFSLVLGAQSRSDPSVREKAAACSRVLPFALVK